MVFNRRREEEECGRNRVLVTRRDRILNEFYTRSANESAIARFVHRIFLIDRSIHFFFSYNISSPFRCFSRLFLEYFSKICFQEKRKIEKENQIIGTDILSKYTSNFPLRSQFR